MCEVSFVTATNNQIGGRKQGWKGLMRDILSWNLFSSPLWVFP